MAELPSTSSEPDLTNVDSAPPNTGTLLNDGQPPSKTASAMREHPSPKAPNAVDGPQLSWAPVIKPFHSPLFATELRAINDMVRATQGNLVKDILKTATQISRAPVIKPFHSPLFPDGLLSIFDEAVTRRNGEMIRQVMGAVGGLSPAMPDLSFVMKSVAAWSSINLSGVVDAVRSAARWVQRQGGEIAWEARMALDAWAAGDQGPMLEFIYSRLGLRPPTEDHVQALSLAILDNSWQSDIDLEDARAVLLALRKAAREGDSREGLHQVAGVKITYLDEPSLQASYGPGPDELAIARIVPWTDQFDDRSVRYATRQLKQQEQVVAREWSEDPQLSWIQAPQLVGFDPKLGESVRRKLLRLGRQINERSQGRVRGETA